MPQPLLDLGERATALLYGVGERVPQGLCLADAQTLMVHTAFPGHGILRLRVLRRADRMDAAVATPPTDPIVITNTAALVPPGVAPNAALDLALRSWLDAKSHKSNSAKTRRAYLDTMGSFRAHLLANGQDLDSDPRAVALAAQAWAGGGEVAPATFNQRLAILSSFFGFARKQGLYDGENPLSRVERRTVHAYATAMPVTPASVQQRLAAIDQQPLAGQRDYALLSVAITTGRRVTELASIRWRDIHLEGNAVTVTFPRVKGGKVMRDTLAPTVAQALLRYLHRVYGTHLGDLPPDTPIWVDSRPRIERQALRTRALQDIGHERLGVHFHALRHTFAHAMERKGAKVSEIQARLGHASLQTTGRYLAQLDSAANTHAAGLADLFGIE